MMKRIMKAVLVLMATLLVAVGYPISVHAQEVLEETQFSQFMKVLQQVDAKIEPNDNAETAFTYEEGSLIWVTGETEDGWYIVIYQGETGYINKNIAQQALAEEEIDVEALDEEFAEQELESKIFVEEVERYHTEVRRSRVWGTIIVLLVIGIFAVGIVSTFRAEKMKKEDNDISEDQQENSHNKEQPKEDINKAQDTNIIDLDEE